MNINQHAFITEYLRQRSAFTAYCLAYNVQDESKFESIMSAAQQLLDDPNVGGVIRSVLNGVRQDIEDEIRAEQKTDVLTIQRKRELLANIATGEMYAVQTYKGKDCTQCTQAVRPTINQMLKAIDLDNKLAGHYSVGKRQLTVGSQSPHKSGKGSELQQTTTNPAPSEVGVQQNTTNTPSVASDVSPITDDMRDPRAEKRLLDTEPKPNGQWSSILVAPFREDRTTSRTELQQNTTNPPSPLVEGAGGEVNLSYQSLQSAVNHSQYHFPAKPLTFTPHL